MNSYNFASWDYHDIEIYAQPCYNKYLLYKYSLFIDIKFLRNHDWLIKWLYHIQVVEDAEFLKKASESGLVP